MSLLPQRARLLPLLALLAVAPGLPAQIAPSAEGWRPFDGSWSATGTRQTLPTEGERPAAVVRVSGTLLLTTGDGLARGFRGEAILFDDGTNPVVGRCVWTDDRGERIYSSLQGNSVEAGRRFTGNLTGGTGRYAGIAGDYSFSWQLVVEADDGVIQGQTVGLAGRFRRGEGSR